MQQPPNYPNWQQPQQPNTQYPPQQLQWQSQYPPPNTYYPPEQRWQQPPLLPQPLPPPFWQQTQRPVRVNAKIASIACFIIGMIVAWGGTPVAGLGDLLLLAGFVLIFLI